MLISLKNDYMTLVNKTKDSVYYNNFRIAFQ